MRKDERPATPPPRRQGSGGMIKKNMGLTVEMWEKIEEDANRYGVSLAYVLREAVGEYYGIQKGGRRHGRI